MTVSPPAPGGPAAVEVRGLVKRYGGRPVVEHLDLTAHAGAVTAVLGPNGAGKTTTVECCEGLRTPDGGTVRVLGLDPAADAAALRPRVGVMLQDGGLPSGARAGEVLRHVAAMYARPRDVGELSERLGIGGFARTTVRRLSGGQRQRLALACALAGRGQVVFLDEPSAGMDPQSRRAVWDLIHELRTDGVAVVLTTHLMDEAADLADHVHIVDHGRVIAAGTVPELLAHDGPHGTTTAARVRIEARPGLDAAALAKALDEATGPAWHVSETEPGVYVADGPVDPAALAAVTAWLADAGTLARTITTGGRTLEDVFLDLTGRHLR
ncbi:ABC transporter ATP-binding protein [Myceligenerans pegani]|uniref:ABC transporter ATP-binding protein n=1 Tax=Myceligenerans pegani TaxID=2776917 RepID=A0ABR9N4B1_9MICO|nr:ABC transporter ATP-binding protein [Myceligenerans sp. TRM 65318]MBE1878504.1 ABC transporter ATP-binding protein [Myceligenerans sp. TRM 65318]MBE3020775.1 ABC transporter ATP-binding protein [Myceligenerans sp. TRM 65318]